MVSFLVVIFLDLDISLSKGKFNTHIARICNNVSDFNDRNLVIKKNKLHHGYRFHKLLKPFTKYYYRYNDLVINTILHA
jgi:hypothetical protein